LALVECNGIVQDLNPGGKGRSPSDQDSVVGDVLTVNAVVRVSEKTSAEYQVMTWLVITSGLVMFIDHLLSKDREDHACTNAKCHGDTGIYKAVSLHDQMFSLGVIINAMSLGIMSAAARQRMSCTFSDALIDWQVLVATLTVVFVAVTAHGRNSRMFFLKLSAVI